MRPDHPGPAPTPEPPKNWDEELEAMCGLAKAWDGVPVEGRARVLDWFAAYALGKPAVWILTEPPRNDY